MKDWALRKVKEGDLANKIQKALKELDHEVSNPEEKEVRASIAATLNRNGHLIDEIGSLEQLEE